MRQIDHNILAKIGLLTSFHRSRMPKPESIKEELRRRVLVKEATLEQQDFYIKFLQSDVVALNRRLFRWKSICLALLLSWWCYLLS